jgi:3-hydroxyisobutyrate dehydrogenase
MRVGIAGLGKMGANIALRLKEVGHDLVVWNRSAGKEKPLAEAGAVLAANPAQLADMSDVIVTILSDAAAIDAVYRGANGILAGKIDGKLVIDMSTVRPETAIALNKDVKAKGAAFVECPVGGTTGPARQGKLLGLAGGTPEDFARAKPLLDQMCRRVEHLGPAGSGSSMKLAINLPLLVAYQALGEAYVLCRHLGMDTTALMELFSDTSGAPNILKVRGPNIAQALAGGPPVQPAFDVDLICKDLRTMIEEAKSRGAELPVAARALSVFEQAAKEGWGPRDGSSLVSYWPSKSGS